MLFTGAMVLSDANNAFVATPAQRPQRRRHPRGGHASTGMNPLLLHWAMVLHPPATFIGYAGCTVPFAYAIAALITGDLSRPLGRARRPRGRLQLHLPHHRHGARRRLGLRGARLGRLLGVGRGGERELHELAHRHRHDPQLHPLPPARRLSVAGASLPPPSPSSLWCSAPSSPAPASCSPCTRLPRTRSPPTSSSASWSSAAPRVSAAHALPQRRRSPRTTRSSRSPPRTARTTSPTSSASWAPASWRTSPCRAALPTLAAAGRPGGLGRRLQCGRPPRDGALSACSWAVCPHARLAQDRRRGLLGGTSACPR